MRYVIASSRKWHAEMAPRLQAATGGEFIFISSRQELTAERLAQIGPRYVFFPHWSFLIPASIHEAFECVIFHMTDLPFGRGGSPLQNLIARGIYQTKITALKCVEQLDAGPVYLKKPLSLHGGAEEIYLRAAAVIEGMVADLVRDEPLPQEQQGEAVCFARRKPEDGEISRLSELAEVYDYIRMLDADGYPKAYLETEHFRLEFQRPALKAGKVTADVIFTRKG